MKRRPFLSEKCCLKKEDTGPYEIRFMQAAMNIRDIFPFLYAALSVIPRYYSEEGTAGISVSASAVWIRPSYIEEASTAEITGMLIHELFHILMGHVLRGRGRDPEKWNLACDQFVNCCIYGIFGVLPGHGPVRLIADGNRVDVSLPDWMPYDPGTDISRDTPEKLYKQILESQKRYNADSGSGSTAVPDGNRGRQGDWGENEEGIQSGEGQNPPKKAHIQADGKTELEDSDQTAGQRKDADRLLDLADDLVQKGVHLLQIIAQEG